MKKKTTKKSTAAINQRVAAFMDRLRQRNPEEPEFHQAVQDVIESVMPVVMSNDEYDEHSILERLVEPDRIISFRVTWRDDNGVVQINRGWRVQFSNAIGPYKGGLRFHPSVNQSI